MELEEKLAEQLGEKLKDLAVATDFLWVHTEDVATRIKRLQIREEYRHSEENKQAKREFYEKVMDYFVKCTTAMAVYDTFVKVVPDSIEILDESFPGYRVYMKKLRGQMPRLHNMILKASLESPHPLDVKSLDGIQ